MSFRPEPDFARAPAPDREPEEAPLEPDVVEPEVVEPEVDEAEEPSANGGRYGAGDSTGPGGRGGARILDDVGALTAERDEYLNALQRLKADFDNYRKRMARLQAEQSARAAQDLVGKLLPVLDNLDLAQAHLGPVEGEGDESEEARALSQARAQLLDVLAKEGLERVADAEVVFDPVVHDAVARVPAECEGDGQVTVDEVMRAGYRWRGQVLRPAMVRVRG